MRKQEKAEKVKQDKKVKDRSYLGTKSDWAWVWTIMVVVSISYSAFVILNGLWGELIPIAMVAPMAIHAGLLLVKGK